MFDKATEKKITDGLAFAVKHILLFAAGSTLYFIVGLRLVISHLSIATIGGFVGSLLNFVILGLGWILFAVIWIFLAKALHNFSKARKEASLLHNSEPVEGTPYTAGEINRIFLEGEKKIKELKEISSQISKTEVKIKVDLIAHTVEKIFELFRENPKEIKKGRQFLNYYLDAALKVLKKYISLKKHKKASADVDRSISHIEESLDTIKNGFDKQLVKLLENDVIDLDVELTVLKNTLKSEGL